MGVALPPPSTQLAYCNHNNLNMDTTASSIIGVIQPDMFEPPESETDPESEDTDTL